jgi:hypothetical protein
MKKYDIHPICACLPEMEEADYIKLRDDIKLRGVLTPVWIYEDQILDGRHRYKAALETGMNCVFNHFIGPDPCGFVIAMNDLRRHLTVSQRAYVAAQMATMEKGRSESNAPHGAAQTATAKALGVSRRSVQRAAVVVDKGTKKQKSDVQSGKKSVAETAAEIAEKDAAKKAASSPSTSFSPELENARRKFRSLFGNAGHQALMEGALANLRGEKELLFFMVFDVFEKPSANVDALAVWPKPPGMFGASTPKESH